MFKFAKFTAIVLLTATLTATPVPAPVLMPLSLTELVDAGVVDVVRRCYILLHGSDDNFVPDAVITQAGGDGVDVSSWMPESWVLDRVTAASVLGVNTKRFEPVDRKQARMILAAHYSGF